MEETSDFDVSDNAAFGALPCASCTVVIAPVTGETEGLRRLTVFCNVGEC